MTTQNHDTVSAFFKGLQDELGIYPAATHDPYDSQVRRIIFAGPSGAISAFVRTPVAQKADNDRLKIVHTQGVLLLGWYLRPPGHTFYLGRHLSVREMLGFDSATRAGCGADTASGAKDLINLSRLLYLVVADGLVRA